MRKRWKITFALGSVVAVACGGAPHAHPEDMSAAAHERAAREHDREVALYAAHLEASPPAASGAALPCASSPDAAPCWTSPEGLPPHAQAHHKMAADHRAASKQLRNAEAFACAGLDQASRDVSPFEHRDDVIGVEELRGKPLSPKTYGSKGPLEGAAITMRAVPGLSKPYLQRLVNCHSARNATMGYELPEMAFCPLAVKGATASVQNAEGAWRVEVKGDSEASAEEIARRAMALVSGR